MGMRLALIAAFMALGLFLGPAWGQTAAGYILTEDHFIWGSRIWGIGQSLEDARKDARRRGTNLDHDGEELNDWVDELTVRPATSELMAAAERDNWTSYRRLSGRVWGTPAEYEATRASRAPRSARAVLPRDLMTREELAVFRARMAEAGPEERITLWHEQLGLLGQRATERGLRLSVPTMRADGTFNSPPEIHGNGPARASGGPAAP